MGLDLFNEDTNGSLNYSHTQYYYYQPLLLISLQTYIPSTGEYAYYDRHFGRSVTENTAKEGQHHHHGYSTTTLIVV